MTLPEVHKDKVWTWPQIDALEQEHYRFGKREYPDGPPPGWPADVEMTQGRLANWLPEGWVNGRRKKGTTAITVYVNVHDNYATYEHVNMVHTQLKKAGGSVRTYTGPIPEPPEWPPWLPHTWAISSKMQAGRSRRIFIHPDGQRFNWDKHSVEKCVNTGTLLGSSIQLEPEVLQLLLRAAEYGTPSFPRVMVEIQNIAIANSSASAGSREAWPSAKLDAGVAALEVDDQGEEGAAARGYSLQPVGSARVWAVLPADVETVTLHVIGARILESGWNCTEKTSERWTFSGKKGYADLALYATGGKLLIRTHEQARALDIADQYSGHCESWLCVEDGLPS